jgi:hypothetical protein
MMQESVHSNLLELCSFLAFCYENTVFRASKGSVRIAITYAGRKGGLDANVLSAYVQHTEEMSELNASVQCVYWCMFHKPPPND